MILSRRPLEWYNETDKRLKIRRSGLVEDQQSDGYAIVLTVDNDCFSCLFVCLFICLFVAYHLE